jgi:hypothetical protein
VTDAAMAWPDGNDGESVVMSGPGGRGRSIRALSGPMQSSDVTVAPTNAPTCSHRRRHARAPITVSRRGTITNGPPTTLRIRAMRVSNGVRISVIHASQRSSSACSADPVRSRATTTVTTMAVPSSTIPATSAWRRRSNIRVWLIAG